MMDNAPVTNTNTALDPATARQIENRLEPYYTENEGVTVGGVENLPVGTTEQDVSNAVSNGFLIEFVNLMKEMIENSDMDNDTKEYLLTELDQLLTDNLTDVDPEVQQATDAQYGDYNADMAKDAFEFFMEMAEDDRGKDAARTDNKGGESGEAEGAGGANWMIQLAKALAEVQSMWLTKLMDAYGRMQENTESAPGSEADPEEKRRTNTMLKQKEFIQAQAEVTAYGRMFGMSSEVTSNVIKSLGDGMTAVSRKN